MHLLSNGHLLLPLLQSTTVTHHQETAQHGSSRALSGHQGQSSDDDHDYLIRLDLGTYVRSESVADRHQADHDTLGRWAGACRTTLADTGAITLDPERAADVESSLGTSHRLNLGSLCLHETRMHSLERNVIRQADMWLREYKKYRTQVDLEYNVISHVWGGDARILSSVSVLEQNSPLSYTCNCGTSPSFPMENQPGSIEHGRVYETTDNSAYLTPQNAHQHARQDARQDKCLIQTYDGNKDFARKYDQIRLFSPVGLTDLQFQKDASQDPQMAPSEVTPANLTAQIACMYTILRTVAGAVLLAQNSEAQKEELLEHIVPGMPFVRV